MKARVNRFQALSLAIIILLSGHRAVAQTTTSAILPTDAATGAGQPEQAEEPDSPASAEDQAFYILIDWIGGLLGLVEGPGVVAGALGGVYAVYEYLKDLKARQQERIENDWSAEHKRRQTEKNFINTLKRTRYAHLLDRDHFKRPFFYGAEIGGVSGGSGVVGIDGGSLADTLSQPMLMGSPQLLEGERAQYELFQAVRSPKPDTRQILEALRSNPALIHAVDEEGNTLLHYAAIIGSVELADLLIQQGADLTAVNNNGHSPLLIAADSQGFNRNVVFIRLLDSLASVSDRELSALFHIIAQRHDTDGISRTLMEVLIRRGFHLRFRFRHIPQCGPVNLEGKTNCQSENGLTLLHEATMVLNAGLVQLFIEQGLLDIEELDDSGNTPLHYAVQHDHTDDHSVVRLLLSLGANINARNHLGETVLHIAVNKNNLRIARRLFSEPELDITIQNSYGDTALFAACRSSGKAAVVECILAASAEDQLINNEGETPLHLAVILPASSDLVNTLLNCQQINSCRIRNHRNNNGQSADDLACASARHILDITLVCTDHISLDAETEGADISDNHEVEAAL